MTTRRWMAVVLYAAMDLAAFHAAVAWESAGALALFVLLTLMPLVAILWWVIRQVRPSTLY
jgi:hypothetical protein